MRLVVLGKTGQVGHELMRSLAPLGEVIGLGRTEADLEDAAALRRAVAEAAPDVIVNAAAYTAVDRAETEPDRADRINHQAVAELGELAVKLGALLVHYSTDYVFDGTKASPYVESDATGPLNVYGSSKRDGEAAVSASGARHLIFRSGWVHGAHRDNFIKTILKLAAERDTLTVVADQVGAPTSAELIADVTAEAITTDLASGLYHLTASGETSWYGLAQFVISEALNLGRSLRVTPEQIIAISTASYPTQAKRPANCRLDTTKLRNALRVAFPDWRVDALCTVTRLIERQAA